MSQPPTPYSRQYNFAGWSVTHPTTPHQGNKLDQEYNALLASVNATISRLSEIQRDDGALRLSQSDVDRITALVNGFQNVSNTAAAFNQSTYDRELRITVDGVVLAVPARVVT